MLVAVLMVFALAIPSVWLDDSMASGVLISTFVGVLSFVSTLIILGAVGEKLGKAYPTLSVDISFRRT
jgi:hypothetical protein